MRVRAPGLLLGLLLVSSAAMAVPTVIEAERPRYQALLHELRCVVCQNQSIAESNAPLAKDLREQVAAQINAGRSDDEIRHYLTDRYGDFVLYKPPLRARTVALWFGPFVLLALGLVMAWWHTRRRRRPSGDAALATSADPAALKDLLGRYRDGNS